jgi:hypothetical protein
MLTNSDPIDEFLILLENPRVHAFFENLVNNVVDKRIKESYNTPEFRQNVDYALLDSESKLLPRLKDVEIVTGLNALYLEDEEHELTLPERIDALEQRTITVIEKPMDELDERETYMPSSKIGKAAIELIKFACERPIVDGSKTITNSVLHQFRKHILPEELRPKESYARQWKRELTDIVSDLAPVRKDKKGNNRGVRLVFPKNFDIGMTRCKLNVS